MARVGEIDPKVVAINKAREKLLFELRRADEPTADKADLARAIDQFVSAKIAFETGQRY